MMGSLAGTMSLEFEQLRMAETWQIVVAASGLLVTVLTVYGALIKTNYDGVTLLKQRLLGVDADDTDQGFLQETADKLDNLDTKMDSHHEEVQTGLMENRRRVQMMENQVERIEYKVDAVQEVVSEEHDVLFRGGSDNRETGGGRPVRENTRLRPEATENQPQSDSSDSN